MRCLACSEAAEVVLIHRRDCGQCPRLRHVTHLHARTYVCRGEYHGAMVDRALLEKVLQLDVESRRELIRAVEGSLNYDDVSAEVLAIVDARLVGKGPRPDADAIPLDEFEARLRARRSA